jgi:hypothetical protein
MTRARCMAYSLTVQFFFAYLVAIFCDHGPISFAWDEIFVSLCGYFEISFNSFLWNLIVQKPPLNTMILFRTAMDILSSPIFWYFISIDSISNKIYEKYFCLSRLHQKVVNGHLLITFRDHVKQAKTSSQASHDEMREQKPQARRIVTRCGNRNLTPGECWRDAGTERKFIIGWSPGMR